MNRSAAPARLGFVDDGPRDGDVVVLLGSLGTTYEMWRPQIDLLARTHRVIAADHRGHGASEVPPGPYGLADHGADVLALLDARHVRRAVVAGSSLGGMVALWLAINAPERIDGLVVIGTSARPGDPASWRERARIVRSAQSTEPIVDAVVSRWVSAEHAALHPHVVGGLRAMLRSIPAEGYAGCCETLAGVDLRAALRGITASTTVVHAVHDPALPFSDGVEIATRIPRATLHRLGRGAHLPSIELPDRVGALMLGALEREGSRVSGEHLVDS